MNEPDDEELPGLVLLLVILLPRKEIAMKYLIIFFLLLLAYTLIYTGISHLGSALTVVENAGG